MPAKRSTNAAKGRASGKKPARGQAKPAAGALALGTAQSDILGVVLAVVAVAMLVSVVVPSSAVVTSAVHDFLALSFGAGAPLVPVALAAAQAAVEDGHSIEVIDLRSLSPLDIPTIEASVQKTGRLVVAHEAPTFGGIGSDIAAAITERCFYHLEAPVIRVGGYHMPYPPAGVEADYVPDLDRILDGIDRAFAY